MSALVKPEGLLLDAWGLAPLNDDHRRDLWERLEERPDCRATIVTSPLPVEPWHEASGEPPFAAARLARLGHNAYTIAWQGETMRKRQATGPRAVPAVEGCLAQRRGAPQA